MDILVVVPTYEEVDNLAPLARAILELDLPVEICVVDDASPDGTGVLADELAAEDPRIHVIHRESKLGIGSAYCAGLLMGLERGARLVITMDGDFSHDPKYLPALVAGMEHHDVMIGSRYIAGGGIRNWGLGRRMLSRTANFVARLVLGFTVHDCTAGLRCYRRGVLERIDPRIIKSDGYSYLEEMIWYCQRAGFRLGEIPIVFADRRRGSSKISRSEIFKAVLTLVRLRFSRLPHAVRRE